MKLEVPALIEIEVKYIRLTLPVRYEEEDMPNDFPLRQDNQWKAVIAVDSGYVQDWPIGRSGSFYMKVTDQGIYELLDSELHIIKTISNDYVPHCIVPGEWGDYVELEIEVTGKVANWNPEPPAKIVEAFWQTDDD